MGEIQWKSEDSMKIICNCGEVAELIHENEKDKHGCYKAVKKGSIEIVGDFGGDKYWIICNKCNKELSFIQE